MAIFGRNYCYQASRQAGKPRKSRYVRKCQPLPVCFYGVLLLINLCLMSLFPFVSLSPFHSATDHVNSSLIEPNGFQFTKKLEEKKMDENNLDKGIKVSDSR